MTEITAYTIQLSACLKCCKDSQVALGGARRTLHFSMEGANFNTELTKKFISVAVWYSFLQQTSHRLKNNSFSMSKFQLSKLIIPCLNNIQQSRFELLFIVNISYNIPKKHIWRSTSFEEIATLYAATSLTLNSVTDIFLQILQSFQNRCR